MTRTKSWAKRAVMATAAFALIAGAASPVLAVGSDTTGSRATGYDSGKWYVSDTKCDAESAYGKYYELGTPNTQRKENFDGCDTTVDGDIGSAVLSVQACRNVTGRPDNCGGWNEW